MTESAPSLRGVRASKSENVIRRSVFLHLRKNAAEIVGVEKRLAASVVGERRERFLRIRVAVEIVEDSVSVVRGLSMQAGVLRFASARKRLQPAHIERINGHVGFHRSGRRRAQRGLIVHARLRNSVAEINDRFFLRDFPERLHDRLQREQFSIRGEGVVVGIVWRERSARFSRALRMNSSDPEIVALPLAGAVGSQRSQHFFLVVGEIEIDLHVRRE